MGTIVNAITIIIGTSLGLFIKNGIPKKISSTIMQGIGLCVILIGTLNSIKTNDMLCVTISMFLGGIIGTLLDVENKLSKFGDFLQSKFGKKSNNKIGEGFITTSLLFCIGAMAVVGSIESGINGNNSILYSKSLLDGISSVIFASTFGYGVYFSALSVLIYQGTITILASFFKGILSTAIITELSAVGGLLILSLGINMLFDKKLQVANFLPAIFIPIFYMPIYNFLASLF
ncbi:MAG: DUF554 domain-containing protein [Christensenellaceae bacterium]|nr:DUF554 domain-containing protein [Christensenellaceae bacterium]